MPPDLQSGSFDHSDTNARQAGPRLARELSRRMSPTCCYYTTLHTRFQTPHPFLCYKCLTCAYSLNQVESRFELPTYGFANRRSTVELFDVQVPWGNRTPVLGLEGRRSSVKLRGLARVKSMGGRRGSNPHLAEPQPGILPLNYARTSPESFKQKTQTHVGKDRIRTYGVPLRNTLT